MSDDQIRKTSRRQSSAQGRSYSSASPDSREAQSETSIWLYAVDAGLMLSVFGVPFAYGGLHSIGQFLLIVAAVISSLAWAAHLLTSDAPNWIRSRVEPFLLAVIAVGILQITPLPESTLNQISPEFGTILPMWSNASGSPVFEGPWPYLSLVVGETRTAIPIACAYALLFVTAVQRIRRVDDATRILRWIACAGCVMAFFAMLQYMFSNGKYFWVFTHPQASTIDAAKGAFLNKNHFSQFTVLCLSPMIVWLIYELRPESDKGRATFGRETPRRIQWPVLLVGLISCIGLLEGSVIAARSRGGFVALCAASAVLFVTLYFKRLISGKQLGVLSATGGVAAFMLLMLNHRQLTRLIDRLDNWSANGRFTIWEANLATFNDFPIAGTGIGSHRYVYPRYLDQPFADREFGHAESSFLQILTETGLLGFSLAVIGILICVYWCARGIRVSNSRQASVAMCAVAASLTGNFVHCVTDIVWHVPGCMAVTVLLAACACRLYQLERTSRDSTRLTSFSFRLPRPTIAMSMLLLIAAGGWMCSIWLPRVLAEPHWWQYRRIALANQIGKGRPDTTMSPEEISDTTLKTKMRNELVLMRKAVRRNPKDARFHIRLAIHYTWLFHSLQLNAENSYALNQIRDAALTGGFQSHEEMREWLMVAFGDNIRYVDAAMLHARRAIELNPLEARGYLYLSELGFLVGADEEFEETCMAQTLELRPFDGQVLFTAGRDALLDGNIELCFDYWKRAYHREAFIQMQITRHMASFTESPVDTIVQVFEPDIPAFERTIEVLDAMQRPNDSAKALQLLGDALIKRAEEADNRDRVEDWLKAAWAFARISETQQVGNCLKNAYRSAPSNFFVNLELGAWFLQQNDIEKAMKCLNFCQRMRPDHPKLRKLLTSGPDSTNDIRQVSGREFDESPVRLLPQ